MKNKYKKKLDWSKILTKKFLVREYSIKKKSTRQIAKEIGCVSSTVWKYLKIHKIPIRTIREGRENYFNYSKKLTKNKLKNKIKNKSLLEISQEVGCKLVTVYRYIKRHSITIKKPINILTKKYLINEYQKHQKPPQQIANEVGCDRVTVNKYLKIHKIKKRSLNQVNAIRRNKKGKNHWNYIHGEGRFPHPLEFNESLKTQIRYRDGYKCQVCGCHEVECSRKLHVHHIDYIKENCTEENLISLCVGCHTRTNYNRKKWKKYFMKKIKENIK